jgi:BRO1-like domain
LLSYLVIATNHAQQNINIKYTINLSIVFKTIMSQNYLHGDIHGPNLDHPDSLIRLASVVHRFKVARIVNKISFENSFKSILRSSGDSTRKLMANADDARKRLTDAVAATTVSAERVVADAIRYQPMIHSILLSCKVQPEQARLDERLIFEWKSGIEEKPDSFRSEAMMYDLVMTCVSEGLGYAVGATEKSISGDFAAANRDYAAAAGIFDSLAEDHLPKWIAKGSNVDESRLPSECHPSMAKALKVLFMANGQQMAIATTLMKLGVPNYGLVAKLCMGVSEQLEEFIGITRREASLQLTRLDPNFLTLVTLQINVHKSLALYFHSRSAWELDDYGVAIALLSEATVALRQRDHAAAHGIPDVKTIPALSSLAGDLKDLRGHMALLLRSWEKDNSSVYFTGVPQQVPVEKKLKEGIQMKKVIDYKLQEAEPYLLTLSEHEMKRSDSELARELQRRLNTGDAD